MQCKSIYSGKRKSVAVVYISLFVPKTTPAQHGQYSQLYLIIMFSYTFSESGNIAA